MTSPPSPPNRRRRRIVVVAAVLLVVTAVSWWYWPRGDATFVGKWDVTSNEPGALRGVMTLRRNGTGSIAYPGTAIRLIPWDADSERFTYGRITGLWTRCVEAVLTVLSPGQLGYMFASRSSWQIVSADDSRIVLKKSGSDGGLQLVLTRIPE